MGTCIGSYILIFIYFEASHVIFSLPQCTILLASTCSRDSFSIKIDRKKRTFLIHVLSPPFCSSWYLKDKVWKFPYKTSTLRLSWVCMITSYILQNLLGYEMLVCLKLGISMGLKFSPQHIMWAFLSSFIEFRSEISLKYRKEEIGLGAWNLLQDILVCPFHWHAYYEFLYLPWKDKRV